MRDSLLPGNGNPFELDRAARLVAFRDRLHYARWFRGTEHHHRGLRHASPLEAAFCDAGEEARVNFRSVRLLDGMGVYDQRTSTTVLLDRRACKAVRRWFLRKSEKFLEDM